MQWGLMRGTKGNNGMRARVWYAESNPISPSKIFFAPRERPLNNGSLTKDIGIKLLFILIFECHEAIYAVASLCLGSMDVELLKFGQILLFLGRSKPCHQQGTSSNAC